MLRSLRTSTGDPVAFAFDTIYEAKILFAFGLVFSPIVSTLGLVTHLLSVVHYFEVQKEFQYIIMYQSDVLIDYKGAQ